MKDIILLFIYLLILYFLYLYLRKFKFKSSLFSNLLLSLTILVFTLLVIIFPEQSYDAAHDGLLAWFNIVLPSLFPFFIGSELLINMGIINIIGTLLEPIMRPIFNVPGCGSFPFIMSITSGYPVGSKIVARLYNEKKCSKVEAQRLLSFCSTSGPLFIIGSVGIGMLKIKSSGLFIALPHYLGAITVGIIFKFYCNKKNSSIKYSFNNINSSLKNDLRYFKNKKQPIGLLLGDAIKNTINSLLLIGGFIILFSVIIRLLIITGFINIISKYLYIILIIFKTNRQIVKPIASGIFEVTTGSLLISSCNTELSQKIIAICGIISWSGFSIHAQVYSMIKDTDLNMKIYIFSKFIHSIFSCIYAKLFLKLFYIDSLSYIQVFEQNANYNKKDFIYLLHSNTNKFLVSILILLSLSLLFSFFNKLYHSSH